MPDHDAALDAIAEAIEAIDNGMPLTAIAFLTDAIEYLKGERE